jgi:hypothetical protein
VVRVKVGDENVGDIDNPVARLQEPADGAIPQVQKYPALPGGHEHGSAAAPEGRYAGPGAENGDLGFIVV